jgi:hypothetical protein
MVYCIVIVKVPTVFRSRWVIVGILQSVSLWLPVDWSIDLRTYVWVLKASILLSIYALDVSVLCRVSQVTIFKKGHFTRYQVRNVVIHHVDATL